MKISLSFVLVLLAFSIGIQQRLLPARMGRGFFAYVGVYARDWPIRSGETLQHRQIRFCNCRDPGPTTVPDIRSCSDGSRHRITLVFGKYSTQPYHTGSLIEQRGNAKKGGCVRDNWSGIGFCGKLACQPCGAKVFAFCEFLYRLASMRKKLVEHKNRVRNFHSPGTSLELHALYGEATPIDL